MNCKYGMGAAAETITCKETIDRGSAGSEGSIDPPHYLDSSVGSINVT